MEKVMHAVCVPANPHDAGDGVKPGSRFMLCTLGGLTLLGPDGPESATLTTRLRKLVAATHHAGRCGDTSHAARCSRKRGPDARSQRVVPRAETDTRITKRRMLQ
jgi:hypothetical protein